jgi:hypothetical protein
LTSVGDGGILGRDDLLIKCRDAIESLHDEIEEERDIRRKLDDNNATLMRENNDLQREI